MIPIIVDVWTSKIFTLDRIDQSAYYWESGDGSCDCNRSLNFEGQAELIASVIEDEPTFCLGCRRFIIVDFKGTESGTTDPENIARMNRKYPNELVQYAERLYKEANQR